MPAAKLPTKETLRLRDSRRLNEAVLIKSQAEETNEKLAAKIGKAAEWTKLQLQQTIEATNRRMRLATETCGVGIWEYDIVHGTCHWDTLMYQLYDLPDNIETAPLKLWNDHLHPDDSTAANYILNDAIAGKFDYDTEYRVICPKGDIRYLRSTGRVQYDKQGRAASMLGICWDVTAMRQLSTELTKQHELLKVTMQSIRDAVITVDKKGIVTWLNPVAERMTGWIVSDALRHPIEHVLHIVHEESRQPIDNLASLCMAQETPSAQNKVAGIPHQTILISRNGEEFGIEVSAAPIKNEYEQTLGMVLVFHDVTEQRRISRELSHREQHDPLTGLVNRAEFETRLERILQNAHEYDTRNAIMFIDLDQFKLVNDACGHTAGDQLLQEVSKLLSAIVRSKDTIARLGGDEFGIILEQCDTLQAQRVAEKIFERLDDFRFIHDDKRFRIGASIGLSPLDKRWTSVAGAMQAADTSCYAAKEAGRNRVHTWYDTDSNMQARQGETQWATRIEHAIDENQFVLFVQRIESLTEESHGLHAEVLIRMRDYDNSIIPPGAFLPAAERFHLTSRLDRWVLQNTISWLLKLPDLSMIKMLCVNLSGKSVGDRAFHHMAVLILEQAGPEICKRICLEITETAAVSNLEDASLFIEQVRALGVKIALDDFGAGASSFGYLKSLKIDVLKIDGQYIKNMMHDALDDSAVRCFVDVARIVGVKTVAEFVENKEILAKIRSIGIDYAQGYLIHKPVAIDALDFAVAELR